MGTVYCKKCNIPRTYYNNITQSCRIHGQIKNEICQDCNETILKCNCNHIWETRYIVYYERF